VFSLAAIVHFGYFRHHARFQAFKSYDTLHIFFALSSTAGYLLSGLRQPSHPARIFSGYLPDPFYLLPARRLPAHVTLVYRRWSDKVSNWVIHGWFCSHCLVIINCSPLEVVCFKQVKVVFQQKNVMRYAVRW